MSPNASKFALLTIAFVSAAGAQEPDVDFPPELVKFAPYKNNPVFKGGTDKDWDAKIRERGWILRDGDQYRMWYTGYDGTKTGMRKLGYATSPDGIRWTRHAKNPLVNDLWIEDMTVIKHDGRYWMFAEGLNDRAHLLVSKDGIAWEKRGPLDVRKKDGTPIAEGPYGTPTVWLEDGVWHLFYERGDLGVWLATSKDMKTWRNVRDEPVMTPGPDAYDRDLIAFNQIIKHKGRYYAYYHGSAKTGPNAGKWCTCVAMSKDLLHWRKYPGNPLLPVAENKSSGILVHDGKRYRLYTMHPEVHLHP